MSDYEPTSRRPIADAFRSTAQGATRFCVRYRIHPDAISYLSVVAATIFGFKEFARGSGLYRERRIFTVAVARRSRVSAASFDGNHHAAARAFRRRAI